MLSLRGKSSFEGARPSDNDDLNCAQRREDDPQRNITKKTVRTRAREWLHCLTAEACRCFRTDRPRRWPSGLNLRTRARRRVRQARRGAYLSLSWSGRLEFQSPLITDNALRRHNQHNIGRSGDAKCTEEPARQRARDDNARGKGKAKKRSPIVIVPANASVSRDRYSADRKMFECVRARVARVQGVCVQCVFAVVLRCEGCVFLEMW